MKTFTSIFSKSLIVVLTLILSLCTSANGQTGSFSRYVSQDGWSGNVEFYVSSGSGAKPLVIGLHPAQSPAWGIRDMIKQSASDKNFILACPDGADASLSESIIPLINYCKNQFSVDESKIILTGYSAGGYTTFDFGAANYSLFKGLIGIAAYGYGVSQSAINSLGFGLICGTSDPMISEVRSFKTQLENSGAYIQLIEVPGVAHTGAYYFSGQFTTDWSSCYDFVLSFIPKPGKITLTSPYSGQEDVEIPVLLEWEEDPNADSYEVEVSDEDGLVERKTPSTNSVSIKNLEPGKEYSWIVRGVNSGGEGEWSNEWWFTTKPVPPTEQVSLTEPSDGAKNLSKNIDFKWSEIPGATEYQIQVLNDADSVVKDYDNILPEDDGTVMKTVRNLALGMTYKWQVRGKNSAGEAPWSEQWTFTTAPAPPGMVLLLEPEHLATEVITFPLFKWNKIENADRYHFQLVDFDTEDIVVEDSSITLVGGDTVVYQITEELDGMNQYKWHVAGINDGGQGNWSEFRIFTTWDPSDIYDNKSWLFQCAIVPNPINFEGYLELNLVKEEILEIKFINVLGQTTIDLGKVSLSSGSQRIPVDLSNFPDGIHFYMVKCNEEIRINRFVIQR
ncbi:MAG: fibronectin type III domain-containing protein [bacterium]